METQNRNMPLNCVDKGMLALHTGNEFMLLHWVLAVAGTVDPVRLRFALASAAARYPALRSTTRTGWLRLTRQIRDVGSGVPLTVHDLRGTPAGTTRDSDRAGTLCQERVHQWMNRPLDPANELPWRVLLLRRSDTESSLVFTFHHAATDGLGAFRFIAEVMRSYDGAAEGAPPMERPHCSCLDELMALARAGRPRIDHFYLKMMVALSRRFVIAPLSPNARVCRSASTPSPAVYFCQGTLNPDELRQVMSRSKAAGATVNDVLLAAAFRTVDQWNAVHGKSSGKISIMVPVDVGRATSCTTLGNGVSFISVATARHERGDLDGLLRTIHRRTSSMLRDGTAFSIVYAVHFCCRFPPVVAKAIARFLLATRVYLDSILVTNVGVIWPAGSRAVEAVRMGNARITSVVVMPPVVSPMGVSLSASTYNGHLHVALSYKTAHFSHPEARLFLNLFLHEMRSYQRTSERGLPPSLREPATREAVLATRPW